MPSVLASTMNKNYLSIALVALAHLSSPAGARATSITASLGNTSPGFFNGQTGIGTAIVLAAMSGSPAPFKPICGSDPGSDCSTSWTFTYAIPAGEVVTAASLTLGIWDLDSKASGNQVALFQIVGGDVLTATFNTAAEALNAGVGSANSEYDVFTFALSSFGALNAGSATVQLTLQAPGLGVLNDTPFNGAGLLFSTLDLTTVPGRDDGGGPNQPGVPEPGTLLLVATGLGAAAARRRRRAKGQLSK
jgi:hypothetical protein